MRGLGVLGSAYEMRQHMPLQVVDLHERDTQTQRQTLGERRAHEQRAQQARTAGERYRAQLLFPHPGALQGRIHHRHDVLLMRTRRQLRHHSAVLFVYFLRSDDVTQHHAAANHRRRRVVARALYAQYYHVFLHFTFFAGAKVLLFFDICKRKMQKKCKNPCICQKKAVTLQADSEFER